MGCGLDVGPWALPWRLIAGGVFPLWVVPGALAWVVIAF
jgi:hypothetical protein